MGKVFGNIYNLSWCFAYVGSAELAELTTPTYTGEAFLGIYMGLHSSS